MLCTDARTIWSLDTESTLFTFWSSKEWLCQRKTIYVTCYTIVSNTYMTGNTFGKTTDPSARYWYSTRSSASSVAYLTSVASTVKTSACVDESGRTSGSSNTFDSLETEDRDPRSCYEDIYLEKSRKYKNEICLRYWSMLESNLRRERKWYDSHLSSQHHLRQRWEQQELPVVL